MGTRLLMVCGAGAGRAAGGAGDVGWLVVDDAMDDLGHAVAPKGKTVPVGQNLDVIFVELGVYTGQRLGTPCDDF